LLCLALLCSLFFSFLFFFFSFLFLFFSVVRYWLKGTGKKPEANEKGKRIEKEKKKIFFFFFYFFFFFLFFFLLLVVTLVRWITLCPDLFLGMKGRKASSLHPLPLSSLLLLVLLFASPARGQRGNGITLMDKKEDTMEWTEEGTQFFNSLSSHFAIISFLGPTKSGKSSLASLLFERDLSTFPVGFAIESKTQGLFRFLFCFPSYPQFLSGFSFCYCYYSP